MVATKLMNTGFLYDPMFLEHQTGAGHPESSERLTVSLPFLQRQSWFNALTQLSARPAALEWIATVHAPDYIKRVEAACIAGHRFLDSRDVSISSLSYAVARLVVGGMLEVADQIINRNIRNGFVLARPPGHHAEHNQAMGFCLFNHVAIVAKYLQQEYQLDKILILDWDVHHGNGTQHTFEADPSVLYISTHQYPFYPGTGARSETGIGKGQGTILNCPMLAGAADEDYEQAFKEEILPKIDTFKPEAIIISAGFDAHADDPLGDINLSTEFFAWMTLRMMEKADQYCDQRIISMLEGGYSLKALPLCIGQHLATLVAGGTAP